MIQKIDNKQKLFRFLKSWVYFWQNEIPMGNFNETMKTLFHLEKKYSRQDDGIHFDPALQYAYRMFGSEVTRIEKICMSLLSEMEESEKRILLGKINMVYSSYKNLHPAEKKKNRVRKPTEWKEMTRNEKLITLAQVFVGDKCSLVKLHRGGIVTIPQRVSWLLTEKDKIIIKSGKFSTCEKRRIKMKDNDEEN